MSSPPLVYYFSGPVFPSYALRTLRHSVSVWAGRVILLHDGSYPETVRGVSSELFLDWYDRTKFDTFMANSPLDPEFRDGFWFHTAERFFVIEQWASREDLNSLAHAELDVVLFPPTGAPENAASWGRGIFYPAGTESHAGASFLFLNDRQVLAQMLDFFVEHAATGDEMHLLWDFLFSENSCAHQLPSHTFFEDPPLRQAANAPLTPEQSGGLFDVQPLGTWILGQDPRNTPKAPDFNHIWLEQIGSPVLKNLSFSYNPVTNRLKVGERGGQRIPVRALHVHSKKISWVTNPLFFAVLVALVNLPFASALTWRNTAKYFRAKGKRKLDSVYLWAVRRRG